MPFSRLVLILACVVSAAALTVWVGVLAFEALGLAPGVAAVAIPVGLIGFLLWRAIAGRTGAEARRQDPK